MYQEEHAKLAYSALTPDVMLDCVEALGFRGDGRFLALNSYENRVYRVGIEDAEPVVAKFYRPQRWSDAAIREEHDFTSALAEQEIPVIAPWRDGNGASLHFQGPYRFAIYPCRGGRPPELDDPDHLEQLGRFIARIHSLGATHPFVDRERLTVADFAQASRQFLLASGMLPDYLSAAYADVTGRLVQMLDAAFADCDSVGWIRIHGDLHAGNVLWTERGPHIVDFDDARMAPAVQDLWMFLSGDRDYMTARLADLLEGYTQFRDFDPAELRLIEPLRTLRMMHYAAWLGRRWDDPAFPQAFPWFNTPRYWEEHLTSLREQLLALDEPPLRWD